MKKNIIYGIIIFAIICVIGLGVWLITKNNNNQQNPNLTDAQKFAQEYTEIGEDNVFVYRSIKEIIKIMENGTGIVYLGFPECPWCQAYVKYLNEVAKSEGVKEIYYFNILNDRTNNTEEYQKIVSILGDNIEYDEEGNHRIYVPNVSFHIDGKLIGNDFETAYDTKDLEKPVDYWTKEEVSDLKNTLTKYTKRVVSALNTCTDCNK